MRTFRITRQTKTIEMKKVLLLTAMVALSALAFAQSAILNGGMENWTGSNQSIEPQYWNSGRSASGTYATFIPQTCFQDNSTYHGGSYSAKIVSGNALGNVVNGALTTGQLQANSTNKAQGYIKDIPTNPDFNMPFVSRPDSFVFWFKYTSVSSDYPRVEARLHVGTAYAPEAPVSGNHPDSSVNIIARAMWTGATSSVGTWTRVSVPFVYVDNRTPAYILITCTSSGDQTGGSQNSTLWLDDFEAIYNPTIATGTVTTVPYYVSASSGASINVPFTLTGTYTAGNVITAQLSDASGSFASPVTLGTSTTGVSGTINGTIPAGTATGTGYRVRVVSSNPALTAANNGSDITINLVSNSIAPSTAQTIAANTDGSMLMLTASNGSTAQEWKYATSAGGPYQSFSPAQTGTMYTPNFAAPGTYYVVAVSSYPGLQVTSNEVTVNVVGNSIAPASSQSILVNTNGTQLTVTETPAGSTREWKYSTTAGGPYVSFAPAQTGTGYTPNFNSGGVYYIVCQSVINSVNVTSNEVSVSVSTVTLSTGTITGSPFEFSVSAPAASVSVPYTTSAAFNGGNTFTAQLSDASGSFTNATTIGSANATASGTITASIPANTPAGTGYRIRVVASNPVVLGNDNGVDLVVDQFSNAIAPVTTQTIQHSVNGTALTVTPSQTATHEWKFTTTSGSNYVSFGTAQTGTTYTPNFATPGTYYVVAVSTNQFNDAVYSNEVQIDVLNGSTLTTSALSGSPFYISNSATTLVNVNFTSDVVFNAGNVFTAQLSDQNGSFANPVNIGTLSGAAIGTINGVIPNSSVAGTAYRIRVVSSDPALTGTDNGTDLVIIPFEITVAPLDTQDLHTGDNGAPITVTTTQTATYLWQYSDVSGLGYTNFNPSEIGSTYTPHFVTPGTRYVICRATNMYNDVLTSFEIVINVTLPDGINGTTAEEIRAWWDGNNFMVDMNASSIQHPVLELMNLTGQVVARQSLNSGTLNTISTGLSQGVYLFRILGGTQTISGKTNKK